ncbi:hypothetical protein TrVE_jg157 [Triparma verrucosa]|uniref:Uncharacterized protein n=1 Tax=Triparma verrucosa TaxID=1606542 RepID=A0A9W7CAM1_9STRA|nr:hypothetical protein TrVE_jg157 [Triparma verrucosa]
MPTPKRTLRPSNTGDTKNRAIGLSIKQNNFPKASTQILALDLHSEPLDPVHLPNLLEASEDTNPPPLSFIKNVFRHMLDKRTSLPTYNRCRAYVKRQGLAKFTYEIREFFNKSFEENWKEHDDSRRWYREALGKWREEHNRGVELTYETYSQWGYSFEEAVRCFTSTNGTDKANPDDPSLKNVIVLSIVFPESDKLSKMVTKCVEKHFDDDEVVLSLADFMTRLKYATVSSLNPLISKTYFLRLHELQRPGEKIGIPERLKFEHEFIGKIPPKESVSSILDILDTFLSPLKSTSNSNPCLSLLSPRLSTFRSTLTLVSSLTWPSTYKLSASAQWSIEESLRHYVIAFTDAVNIVDDCDGHDVSGAFFAGRMNECQEMSKNLEESLGLLTNVYKVFQESKWEDRVNGSLRHLDDYIDLMVKGQKNLSKTELLEVLETPSDEGAAGSPTAGALNRTMSWESDDNDPNNPNNLVSLKGFDQSKKWNEMVVQPTLKTLKPTFKAYLKDLLEEVNKEGEALKEMYNVAMSNMSNDVDLGISEFGNSQHNNTAVNFMKITEEERLRKWSKDYEDLKSLYDKKESLAQSITQAHYEACLSLRGKEAAYKALDDDVVARFSKLKEQYEERIIDSYDFFSLQVKELGDELDQEIQGYDEELAEVVNQMELISDRLEEKEAEYGQNFLTFTGQETHEEYKQKLAVRYNLKKMDIFLGIQSSLKAVLEYFKDRLMNVSDSLKIIGKDVENWNKEEKAKETKARGVRKRQTMTSPLNSPINRDRGRSALDIFKEADVEEVQEAVDESAIFLRDERKMLMTKSDAERVATRMRAAAARKISLDKYSEEKRKLVESIQLKELEETNTYADLHKDLKGNTSATDLHFFLEILSLSCKNITENYLLPHKAGLESAQTALDESLYSIGLDKVTTLMTKLMEQLEKVNTSVTFGMSRVEIAASVDDVIKKEAERAKLESEYVALGFKLREAKEREKQARQIHAIREEFHRKGLKRAEEFVKKQKKVRSECEKSKAFKQRILDEKGRRDGGIVADRASAVETLKNNHVEDLEAWRKEEEDLTTVEYRILDDAAMRLEFFGTSASQSEENFMALLAEIKEQNKKIDEAIKDHEDHLTRAMQDTDDVVRDANRSQLKVEYDKKVRAYRHAVNHLERRRENTKNGGEIAVRIGAAKSVANAEESLNRAESDMFQAENKLLQADQRVKNSEEILAKIAEFHFEALRKFDKYTTKQVEAKVEKLRIIVEEKAVNEAKKKEEQRIIEQSDKEAEVESEAEFLAEQLDALEALRKPADTTGVSIEAHQEFNDFGAELKEALFAQLKEHREEFGKEVERRDKVKLDKNVELYKVRHEASIETAKEKKEAEESARTAAVAEYCGLSGTFLDRFYALREIITASDQSCHTRLLEIRAMHAKDESNKNVAHAERLFRQAGNFLLSAADTIQRLLKKRSELLVAHAKDVKNQVKKDRHLENGTKFRKVKEKVEGKKKEGEQFYEELEESLDDSVKQNYKGFEWMELGNLKKTDDNPIAPIEKEVEEAMEQFGNAIDEDKQAFASILAKSIETRIEELFKFNEKHFQEFKGLETQILKLKKTIQSAPPLTRAKNAVEGREEYFQAFKEKQDWLKKKAEELRKTQETLHDQAVENRAEFHRVGDDGTRLIDKLVRSHERMTDLRDESYSSMVKSEKNWEKAERATNIEIKFKSLSNFIYSREKNSVNELEHIKSERALDEEMSKLKTADEEYELWKNLYKEGMERDRALTENRTKTKDSEFKSLASGQRQVFEKERQKKKEDLDNLVFRMDAEDIALHARVREAVKVEVVASKGQEKYGDVINSVAVLISDNIKKHSDLIMKAQEERDETLGVVIEQETKLESESKKFTAVTANASRKMSSLSRRLSTFTKSHSWTGGVSGGKLQGVMEGVVHDPVSDINKAKSRKADAEVEREEALFKLDKKKKEHKDAEERYETLLDFHENAIEKAGTLKSIELAGFEEKVRGVFVGKGKAAADGLILKKKEQMNGDRLKLKKDRGMKYAAVCEKLEAGRDEHKVLFGELKYEEDNGVVVTGDANANANANSSSVYSAMDKFLEVAKSYEEKALNFLDVDCKETRGEAEGRKIEAESKIAQLEANVEEAKEKSKIATKKLTACKSEKKSVEDLITAGTEKAEAQVNILLAENVLDETECDIELEEKIIGVVGEFEAKAEKTLKVYEKVRKMLENCVAEVQREKSAFEADAGSKRSELEQARVMNIADREEIVKGWENEMKKIETEKEGFDEKWAGFEALLEEKFSAAKDAKDVSIYKAAEAEILSEIESVIVKYKQAKASYTATYDKYFAGLNISDCQTSVTSSSSTFSEKVHAYKEALHCALTSLSSGCSGMSDLTSKIPSVKKCLSSELDKSSFELTYEEYKNLLEDSKVRSEESSSSLSKLNDLIDKEIENSITLQNLKRKKDAKAKVLALKSDMKHKDEVGENGGD